MRKLIAFNLVTLDGFFEGPDHDINWHNVDDEFNEFAIEQTSSLGTLLFGRVTYQMMEAFWPTPMAIQTDPIVAGLMNGLPKVVFSRSLEKAEWNNTRLIKDHIAEEVTALKQQTGKDMAVFGSADLLTTLIQMDLVDEHRLLVNPIVLGSGSPIFKNVKNSFKLKLIKTRVFQNGNILLCYTPDRK
jgi:dihydrofolate reductase